MICIENNQVSTCQQQAPALYISIIKPQHPIKCNSQQIGLPVSYTAECSLLCHMRIENLQCQVLLLLIYDNKLKR